MKTFTDAAGRTWRIALTLGAAMRVKDALGIDLLQPEQASEDDPTPVLTRLGTDEILLGEVICCLLADQFEANRVTEQDVRDAFDGKTLLAAQQAFYEELIDFFQSRGRSDRAKAVATQARVIEAAVRAVEAKLEAIDIDAEIAAALPGVNLPGAGAGAGAMSGSSPAPSASAPTNSAD